ERDRRPRRRAVGRRDRARYPPMSHDYELRVIEDVVASPAVRAMDAAHRVLYVVEGDVTIVTGEATVTLGANQAWQGSMACRVTVRAAPARVWRWELREGATRSNPVDRVKLARRVQLDSDARCLMRCDRVDFPPGGVAYTHVHQGPGIRML